jgi:hypothetical protein
MGMRGLSEGRYLVEELHERLQDVVAVNLLNACSPSNLPGATLDQVAVAIAPVFILCIEECE